MMRIESMCVVCHGPVRRTQCPVTAIVCNDNCGMCYGVWRRMRDGAPLPLKYEQLRYLHAYRRSLETLQRRIDEQLSRRWSEVAACVC